MAGVAESDVRGRVVAARLSAGIPNALSLGRAALGLVFVWIPVGWRAAAVLGAALSDLLDGFASRRLHAASTLGRVLDPVADKVFVAGVVGTLLFEGRLGWGQAALVGLRDLAVLAGAGWVLASGDWSALGRMPPRLLGKATTAAQLLFLLALAGSPRHASLLFPPTAALSGLAAADYLRAFLSRSPGRRPAPPDDCRRPRHPVCFPEVCRNEWEPKQ